MLKGLNPDYSIENLIQKKEPLQILTYSEKLIPDFLISELQKKLHSKIKIKICKTYNELLSLSVTESNFSIFIIPRHWSEAIKDQGLLLPLSGLKDFFQKKLHADFPVISSRIFPWAWVPTQFTISNKADIKKISKVQIVDSNEHIYQILKKVSKNDSNISFEKISLFNNIPSEKSAELKEVNTFENTEKNYHIESNWPQSLFLFDIVIPQNTPQRTTSIEILQILFSDDTYLKEFAGQPFGVTAAIFDTSLFPAEKKPSAIRNQTLQKLLRPISLEKEEMNTYLRKFKIN